MIWLAVAVTVIAFLLGIWLGRSCFAPLPSFEKRKQEYWEEQKKIVDDKVREWEMISQGRIREKLNALEAEALEKTNELKESIRTLTYQELQERYRVNTVIVDLQTKIKEKSDEFQMLDYKQKALVAALKEYEENAIATKKRILQNYRYKRQEELKQLEAEYDKVVRETAVAIELIKAKMDEWSSAERIAYEERMSRDEVARLNRISLSDLSIEELKELYEACRKLKLSNTVPLYKAIYEIYLRGPVKELGVKLGAAGVCGIYKITNNVSGKVYVGQSVDIAERWKQHIKRGTKCEVGTMSGAGLYEAMWLDGIWNFSFQILEACEKDNLTAREKFWISHFQSNEIGYNKKG